MSAEQRIERLRPVLVEWERGNFAAGAEIFSADVVLSSFSADGVVVSRGWEEIGVTLRDFFAQWADYRIEVGDLQALDDATFLMAGRQFGVGKRSGIEIVETLYIVFRFEGELVSEMHWHPDRGEALRVAGLGE